MDRHLTAIYKIKDYFIFYSDINFQGIEKHKILVHFDTFSKVYFCFPANTRQMETGRYPLKKD